MEAFLSKRLRTKRAKTREGQGSIGIVEMMMLKRRTVLNAERVVLWDNYCVVRLRSELVRQQTVIVPYLFSRLVALH